MNMMNINGCNLMASSISENSFPIMACRSIHVLLVDHESGGDHDNITNLLNYFSYKVTLVKHVSAALSILSNGKVEFDLLMVNMNSPESLGFQLLDYAIKMKLLVIFMSNEDDDVTTMRALEQGAFVCLRKPLSMSVARTLWQFVLSEKVRRQKEIEPSTKMIDYNYFQEKQHDEEFVLESNQNYKINSEENHKSETNSNSGASKDYRVGYKRKPWTEWTLDLHRKFMAAARYLGEGRCYPKDILEIMNVPGLTRMQVASHLQKCRNYKWLPPNERKSKAGKREKQPKQVVITKPPRDKRMRFGLLPFGQYEPSKFQQSFQEFQDAMNRQELAVNPPTRTTAFGPEHCESSITPLLDRGLYSFDPDNVGQGEQFSCGGYLSVAPNPNFLPKLTTEAPHEFFPIVDSGTVRDLPDFQQHIEVDFDAEWESFIREGQEHNLQVSAAVADANNQWFSDELFNLAVENEETEEDKVRKMG